MESGPRELPDLSETGTLASAPRSFGALPPLKHAENGGGIVLPPLRAGRLPPLKPANTLADFNHPPSPKENENEQDEGWLNDWLEEDGKPRKHRRHRKRSHKSEKEGSPLLKSDLVISSPDIRLKPEVQKSRSRASSHERSTRFSDDLGPSDAERTPSPATGRSRTPIRRLEDLGRAQTSREMKKGKGARGMTRTRSAVVNEKIQEVFGQVSHQLFSDASIKMNSITLTFSDFQLETGFLKWSSSYFAPWSQVSLWCSFIASIGMLIYLGLLRGDFNGGFTLFSHTGGITMILQTVLFLVMAIFASIPKLAGLRQMWLFLSYTVAGVLAPISYWLFLPLNTYAPLWLAVALWGFAAISRIRLAAYLMIGIIPVLTFALYEANPLLGNDIAVPLGILVPALFFGYLGAYYIERSSRHLFCQLYGLSSVYEYVMAEQRDVEKLLSAVLPDSVRVAFKQTPDTYSRVNPNVGILLASVSDFESDFCKRTGYTVDEEVDLINELFGRFDKVVKHFDLEHLGTYGTTYIAAAGFEKGGADSQSLSALGRCSLLLHYEATKLAMEARKVKERKDYDEGDDSESRKEKVTLSLRVSVDAGAMASAISGDFRQGQFGFGLWGEPIVVLSAFDHQCVPGTTLISSRFRASIAADDAFSITEENWIKVEALNRKMKPFRLGTAVSISELQKQPPPDDSKAIPLRKGFRRDSLRHDQVSSGQLDGSTDVNSLNSIIGGKTENITPLEKAEKDLAGQCTHTTLVLRDSVKEGDCVEFFVEKTRRSAMFGVLFAFFVAIAYAAADFAYGWPTAHLMFFVILGLRGVAVLVLLILFLVIAVNRKRSEYSYIPGSVIALFIAVASAAAVTVIPTIDSTFYSQLTAAILQRQLDFEFATFLIFCFGMPLLLHARAWATGIITFVISVSIIVYHAVSGVPAEFGFVRYTFLVFFASLFTTVATHSIQHNMILAFVAQRKTMENRPKLRRVQDESRRLLLCVAPPEAAVQWKTKGCSPIFVQECGGVMCFRVVGMTSVISSRGIDRALELQNSLTESFDRICDKHGVSKMCAFADRVVIATPATASEHNVKYWLGKLCLAALEMAGALVKLKNRHIDASELQVSAALSSGRMVCAAYGDKEFWDCIDTAASEARWLEVEGRSGVVLVTRAIKDLMNDHFIFNQFVRKDDHKVPSDSELRAAFSGLDYDGDGNVEASELAPALAKFGFDVTVEEAQDIIDEADIDGDGCMQYEEFCAFMKSEGGMLATTFGLNTVNEIYVLIGPKPLAPELIMEPESDVTLTRALSKTDVKRTWASKIVPGAREQRRTDRKMGRSPSGPGDKIRRSEFGSVLTERSVKAAKLAASKSRSHEAKAKSPLSGL